MQGLMKTAGWLIAVVLGLALGAVIYDNSIKAKQIEALMQENVQLKQSVAALQKINDLSKAEQAATETKPAAPPELPVFSVPGDFDPASLVQNMLSQSQTAEMDSPFDPLANLFNSQEGRRMADFSARTAINMQYRDLFQQLALPPETEAQVKELLQQFASDAINAGLKALSGNADAEGMQQANLERETQLRNNLAQLLTPEELAQYDAYQEALPEKMLEQSYETMLRMYGTGLSEESIQMVKQVLVEETLHLKPDPDIPPADAMQTYAVQQEEAFARALERLAPDLSEEEYAAVEDFIEQQQTLVDSVARVLDWRKPLPAQPGS